MKRHFWPTIAWLVTYGLGMFVVNHELHLTTAKQILAVISWPIFPAMVVSFAVNWKWIKPHIKKFYWRMSVGMVAYALGLIVLNHIYTPQLPYKYWLILLPGLPMIYVSFATIRFIADSDELWRKIYMEAWAFSGIATGFTCFSYLFIRDMGAPAFHSEWAFYIMWAYYLIGFFFSWRRYK
jgi:type IV secretory pathway TrbD component